MCVGGEGDYRRHSLAIHVPWIRRGIEALGESGGGSLLHKVNVHEGSFMKVLTSCKVPLFISSLFPRDEGCLRLFTSGEGSAD